MVSLIQHRGVRLDSGDSLNESFLYVAIDDVFWKWGMPA
ncbi:hypothetical protein HNO89_000836 [Sporosarcina luteola]|nr:hypothetical protein [Sporosarcina luteola]